MNSNIDEIDLNDRLRLIESMIAEGRRKTESWCWTFVLWGVAYYVAIAWSMWGHSSLAWPVTMVAAGILTAVNISRTSRDKPETTLGRSMAALWLGMGISVFSLLMALSLAGHFEFHVFVAIVGSFLGSANAASGIILKWKMQFACALVWWICSIAACFGTDAQVIVIFLAAIFFCQIVFGIYGMIADARKQRQAASHA